MKKPTPLAERGGPVVIAKRLFLDLLYAPG